MRREVELQEEIDRIKVQYQQEKTATGVKNLLDRSKSRGRGGDENTGVNANNGMGSQPINMSNQKPPTR